jgi:hypothetical protein
MNMIDGTTERIPYGGQNVDHMLLHPETINWDILTKEERIAIQNWLLYDYQYIGQP